MLRAVEAHRQAGAGRAGRYLPQWRQDRRVYQEIMSDESTNTVLTPFTYFLICKVALCRNGKPHFQHQPQSSARMSRMTTYNEYEAAEIAAIKAHYKERAMSKPPSNNGNGESSSQTLVIWEPQRPLQVQPYRTKSYRHRAPPKAIEEGIEITSEKEFPAMITPKPVVEAQPEGETARKKRKAKEKQQNLPASLFPSQTTRKIGRFSALEAIEGDQEGILMNTADKIGNGKGRIIEDIQAFETTIATNKDEITADATTTTDEKKIKKQKRNKTKQRARNAKALPAAVTFVQKQIEKRQREATIGGREIGPEAIVESEIELGCPTFSTVKASETYQTRKAVDPTDVHSELAALTIRPETMSPTAQSAPNKRDHKAGNSKQYQSRRTTAAQQLKRLHELARHNMVAQSPYFPRTQQALALHVQEYGTDVLRAGRERLEERIARKQAEKDGKIPKVDLAFYGRAFENPGGAVTGESTIWVPEKDSEEVSGSAALRAEDIEEEEVAMKKAIERRQVLVLWPGLSELKQYGELEVEKMRPRLFPEPRYAERISWEHAGYLLRQGHAEGAIVRMLQAGPVARDLAWEIRQPVKAFPLDERTEMVGQVNHTSGLSWGSDSTLVGGDDCDDRWRCVQDLIEE